MINDYFTDKISISKTAYDDNGVLTTSAAVPISCRVQDSSRLVKNKDGKEIVAMCLIFLPAGTNIDYFCKIQILEISGIAPGYSGKSFEVQKITTAHGFLSSHIEVII